jgi:hypothetical protein
MAKRFNDYSERWRNNQLDSGVDPARWNRWANLSPSTRREVNRAEYARGFSASRLAQETRTQRLVDRWVAKLEEAGTSRPPKPGVIRQQIGEMTKDQKRTLKQRLDSDTPSQFRNRAKTRLDADGNPIANRYRY